MNIYTHISIYIHIISIYIYNISIEWAAFTCQPSLMFTKMIICTKCWRAVRCILQRAYNGFQARWRVKNITDFRLCSTNYLLPATPKSQKWMDALKKPYIILYISGCLGKPSFISACLGFLVNNNDYRIIDIKLRKNMFHRQSCALRIWPKRSHKCRQNCTFRVI